ncbi:MAG: amino acid ABC transporter substrate-binding protein [Acidobacteria bacterium]|nr:MAG: amino acid ABC transporter substrate-binding protein [Acidobacteriota bacterium]
MRNRILLVLILTALFSSIGLAEIYDLGGMYTYHYRDGRYADWGDFERHGARIAIQEINASGILGDDRIRMKDENIIDYHCWPENAAIMAETLMKKGILVLTGADCSGPAVEIARVGAKYEIPVISNGANASMLSSVEDFPYFVRVVTPSEQYEGYLIDMAAHFGVEEIALFYTTDAWGLGAKNVINQYAKRHAIKIAQEYGYPRDTPYEEIKAYMEKVKQAGIKHIFNTSPTPDAVRMFRALHELGMNAPGYSFYAAEMISADEAPEAVAGSLGYFAPMNELMPSPKLSQFKNALEKRLGKPVDPSSKAFFYGALSYDHILAVGYAIRDIKYAGDDVTSQNMMKYLRKMDFDGATGHVSLVPGTNDRANMPVQIFNSHGYKADGKTVDLVSVGSVDPATGRLTVNEGAIVWPGNVTTPPRK